MTLRRKILLAITIIPIILLLNGLIRPIREGDQHNAIELIFLVVGLPILLLIYLEWTDPQFMDEIFGKPRQAVTPTPSENALTRLLPQGMPVWKALAVLCSVLLLGFAMGAGAIFIINQQNPKTAGPEPGPKPARSLAAATSLTPGLTGTIEVETIPEGTIEPGTIEAGPIEPIGTPDTKTPDPALLTPTEPLFTPTIEISATATTGSPTQITPSVTADVSRCTTPTQVQIAVIQAGLNLVDPSITMRKSYLVKSIAKDKLWFFAAFLYGASFDNGISTEPAVWSFYEDNNIPNNIYATNDLSYQNSEFVSGSDANPPIDMQVDGANIAYQCAVKGK
jgi:hypothetical protein